VRVERSDTPSACSGDVGLSSELCKTKIQMPANETPQLKIGEVSEPIARALNQLELVVNGANGEFGQNRTLSLKVFSCMTYRIL